LCSAWQDLVQWPLTLTSMVPGPGLLLRFHQLFPWDMDP